MRAKSLVLLVVALGCGMVAAVGVSKAVMDNGSKETVEASVEIFVAVKDLPHAEPISAENVKLEKWPKSRVPEGALYDLAQVEGKFTKQFIFPGEPILERKLTDSREGFSTNLPQGYRIFDISGSAGYIKPGDHVDILGTFKIGGRNAAPESRTVMRNVKVHGINGSSTRDGEKDDKGSKSSRGGTTFQLLVKESQLEALTLANSLGELQLNLRPFGEGDDEASRTDNGESFLSWVSEAGAEDPIVERPDPSFLAQALTIPEAPKEEPKSKMLIITPNGVTTYEWSSDKELPSEVKPDAEKLDTLRAPTDMPASGYSYSSGNVYSGYGGYTPTYPTSVNPSAPADGTGSTASPGTSASKID